MVCVCLQICVHVNVHVCGGQSFIFDVFHYFSTLFTEEGSLTEPETSRFRQPSYPDCPWDPLSLPLDWVYRSLTDVGLPSVYHWLVKNLLWAYHRAE